MEKKALKHRLVLVLFSGAVFRALGLWLLDKKTDLLYHLHSIAGLYFVAVFIGKSAFSNYTYNLNKLKDHFVLS